MHMKLSPEQSNKVIFSEKQASVQLCAFELDHCMSLCGNHTINNMSCSRRGELERIKTFICMIMFALPEALYGHEWQFDFWGDAGGQIAAAENETLVDAPSTGVSQSFSFRYMVIYLNSFWQIMPHEFHLWVRTLDTAHNDDMTVYGVVAFESHSKGSLDGFNDKNPESMIARESRQVNAPWNQKPARCYKGIDRFYRYKWVHSTLTLRFMLPNWDSIWTCCREKKEIRDGNGSDEFSQQHVM